MVQLKNKKHQETLFKQITKSLGGQISDGWERDLYQQMVQRTVFKPVDELKSKPGWKTQGQNVHHVIIGPRGKRVVGPIEVYVPQETLGELKGLSSRDKLTRERAEDALHTVSHELAHDYFKGIDYEARMTRYLKNRPKVTESHLRRFLVKSGKYNNETAKREAEQQIKKNPLFWANYVAHTAHEAGADLMAAETVMQISQGRHATGRDLERLTAFRPYTIRELEKQIAGERRTTEHIRPRKPNMWERMSKKLERGSWEFMEHAGGLYNVSHPRAGAQKMAEGMQEMRNRQRRHR